MFRLLKPTASYFSICNIMLAEVWLILTSTTLLKKHLWRILSGFLDLLRLSTSPMSSPSSSFLLIKFYFYLYKPGCNSGEQHCRDQKVPHHPSLCPSISSPNSNIIYFTYLIFCNLFFCRSHTWRFPNRHHCVVRPLSNVKKKFAGRKYFYFLCAPKFC